MVLQLYLLRFFFFVGSSCRRVRATVLRSLVVLFPHCVMICLVLEVGTTLQLFLRGFVEQAAIERVVVVLLGQAA